MKKTGLNGYIYNFSVDYDAIAVDNILEIHNYLIKIMIYYKMFGLIKKAFFFCRIYNFIKHKSVKCNSLEIYFNG